MQFRTFYITSIWNGQESSSKVEDTIKNIKEQKELEAKTQECVVHTSSKSKVAEKKPPIWERIKAEILHYYHGFRLLGLDMKISAKLIWRILQGKELSRREHRLVSYK